MSSTAPSNISRSSSRHRQRNIHGYVPNHSLPSRPSAWPHRNDISGTTPNTKPDRIVRLERPSLMAYFNPNASRPPPKVEFTSDPARSAPIWMQRGHDWGSETSKPDIERHIHKEHIETISNDRTARPAGAIPSGKLPLEFGLEWVSREPTSAFGQRDIRAGQGLGMSTLNSGMPNQFRRVVDETPITANAAQFVPGYKGEVYGPVSENAQRQS